MLPLRRPNLVTAFPCFAYYEGLPIKVDMPPPECQNLPSAQSRHDSQVEAGVIVNVTPGPEPMVGKKGSKLLPSEYALLYTLFLYSTYTCSRVSIDLLQVQCLAENHLHDTECFVNRSIKGLFVCQPIIPQMLTLKGQVGPFYFFSHFFHTLRIPRSG